MKNCLVLVLTDNEVCVDGNCVVGVLFSPTFVVAYFCVRF